MANMVRMRLLNEAIEDIKLIDPHTAITRNYIRQLAIENKIPCTMVGRKRLINLDALLDYLANISQKSEAGNISNIRRIPAKLPKAS